LVLLPLVLVLDLIVVLALGLLPLNSVAGLSCDPLLRGGEARATDRLAAPIRKSADKLCSDAVNGRRGAIIAVGLIVLLFGTGAVFAPADRLERALVRSREEDDDQDWDSAPGYDPARAQAEREQRQREELEAAERRAAWMAGLSPEERTEAELAPVAELPPGVMGELEAPKPVGAAAKRSRAARPSGVKATKATKATKAKKVTAKKVTKAKKVTAAKKVVRAGVAPTKAAKATKSAKVTKAAKVVSARGASTRPSKVGTTRGGRARPIEAEVVPTVVPLAPTKAVSGRRTKAAKAAPVSSHAAIEAAPAGRTTARPKVGTRRAGPGRLAPVRAPVDAEPAVERDLPPPAEAPAEPVVADAPNRDAGAAPDPAATVEVPVVAPEPEGGGRAARTARAARAGTRSVAGTRSRRR